MTIMARLVRLCRADIHGVVDQLEDKGLILKQCLREMERVIDQKESAIKKMLASENQAKREHEIYSREVEKVEQDLKVALEKDEDSIARLLIKKLRPLTHHLEEIDRYIEDLDKEITRQRDCLKEQSLQYEQLRLRSLEYFQALERKKWEKSDFSGMPREISTEPSDAEIEIELLKRKEAIKGGEKKWA